MRKTWVVVIAAAATLSGCNSDEDVTPPAAPRGVYSVTGDHEVFLSWLANTEHDVAGYRIYEGPCARGPGCPYDLVTSTTGTSVTVTGLANGSTRFFAVAAYDRSGNEGDLSYETVFDTPRPEGFDVALSSHTSNPASSGWDFSAQVVRSFDHSQTDIYFEATSGSSGWLTRMLARDGSTQIQDAGYASTLDAVDYAPNGGWSANGEVDLTEGHCYVVWTRDNHYAKFRVTRFDFPPSGPPAVVFDWAYQVDTGNRELKVRPATPAGGVSAARVPAR